MIHVLLSINLKMSGTPPDDNVPFKLPFDSTFDEGDDAGFLSDDSIFEEMLLQVNEAEAEEKNRKAAEMEEETPQPGPTPEQIAQVAARPRRVPKLRPVASSSSGPSAGRSSRPLPLPSFQQSTNSDPSPGQLDPESAAEPLQDKGKGKEVLLDVPAHERPHSREEVEGLQRQVDLLRAQNAEQDGRIAAQAEENRELQAECDELRAAAITYMADVERDRQVQREERDRMVSEGRSLERDRQAQQEERDRMVSEGKNLEQRLASQTQQATRLQARLVLERRTHAAVLQERTKEQERQVKELTDQLQQLRTKQLREQAIPPPPSTQMDAARTFRLPIRLRDPSRLPGQMEDSPMEDSPIPVPASSAPTSTDRRRRQTLRSQKASNKSLRQDIANLKATIANQKATIDSQKTSIDGEKETVESLKKNIAEYHAKASQPPVDDCETRQQLEARLDEQYQRELDELAGWYKQRFKDETDALRADKDVELAKAATDAAARVEAEHLDKVQELDRLEKKLEASRAETQRHQKACQTARAYSKFRQDESTEFWRINCRLVGENESLSEERRLLSEELEEVKKVARDAERRADREREDAGEMAHARGEAEATANSLRSANLALEKDKKEFTAEARSTKAKLEATSAELEGVRRGLAESEAALEKKEEKIRGLERFVDGQIEVWDVWNEGMGLRRKIPGWKVFWILLLMWILFASVVLGFFVILNNQGSGQRQVREDPWLDLSRVMYGGGEGGGW